MSVEVEKEIHIRGLDKGDVNYIYSTWLNGFYFGSTRPKNPATKNTEFHFQNEVVKTILDNPNTFVAIACLRSEPDVIIGYSVFETKDNSVTLHWVFVKEAWRRLGVATMIVPKEVNEVTHLTKLAKAIKPHKWNYNPFFF